MSNLEGTIDTTATLKKLRCPICGKGPTGMLLWRSIREKEGLAFVGTDEEPELGEIRSAKYEADGWDLFCNGSEKCRMNSAPLQGKAIELGLITRDEWDDLMASADDGVYE